MFCGKDSTRHLKNSPYEYRSKTGDFGTGSNFINHLRVLSQDHLCPQALLFHGKESYIREKNIGVGVSLTWIQILPFTYRLGFWEVILTF